MPSFDPARHLTRHTLSGMGPLQAIDVDFLHLQHGFHGSLGFFGIGIIHHLWQNGRNHLPGNAIFVLEPAVSLRLSISTLRELFPIIVHSRRGYR